MYDARSRIESDFRSWLIQVRVIHELPLLELTYLNDRSAIIVARVQIQDVFVRALQLQRY
jgi:hypothetical protein